MFIENKFTRVYYRIIDRALTSKRSGYIEKHHIIPRSMGGSNKKDNIVALTPREHYICHLLLVKMTEGIAKRSMTYAAWTMARTRKIKVNSRTYARLKEQATAQLIALQKGIKRGPMSEEHKQKIRDASIARYKDPAQRLASSIAGRGRIVTEETKAKLRLAKIGAPAPKPSYGMQGKTHSPETLAKMREAWVKRKAS